MEAYQERVVAEKAELDVKVKKLEEFIYRGGQKFESLPDAERLRLTKQYCHMKDYSGILGERIAAF